jgi:ferrous iron transport protein B
MGRFIEPVITPLGYDWKIGVALVASLAAREVAVSALGTIYSIGDADETSERLIDRMRADVNPKTGKPTWTPLVAASMMVFFVLACQCLATVAVVKRETASWRWPLFMFGYMTLLAWVAAFVTYQGGTLLGLS